MATKDDSYLLDENGQRLYFNFGDENEFIVHWVRDGSIDLGMPLEDWRAWERNQTELDGELEKIRFKAPEGSTKWMKAGSVSTDGGCLLIAQEYLTEDAAKKIMLDKAEKKEKKKKDAGEVDEDGSEDKDKELDME